MDDELRILNMAQLPSALDALDDQILHALARRQRESAATRRMMAFAAFVSLGGGFVAGSAFIPPAVAASPLSPLIPASPLAPSSLLDSR
jgi:hypothetical protein